jgi:hypothetical protein
LIDTPEKPGGPSCLPRSAASFIRLCASRATEPWYALDGDQWGQARFFEQIMPEQRELQRE